MTERYSRPRTPPGPPPLGMPRKNSNPSSSPRPASTQPLSSREPMSSKPSYRGPTKDIDVKPYDSKGSYEKYNKYEKMYPSKMYDNSKYDVPVVRKSTDKFEVSNYPARSDTYKYSEPVYKGKDSSYLSDRYGEVKYPSKDSRYQADSRYTSKYEDQYPIADDQYISKYGSSKKDPVYSGKVGRVSKYDDEKYYDGGSPYSSYDAYGSGPRMGASSGGGMGGGAGSSYYDDKFSRPLPKRYLDPDREPYPDYNGVPRRDRSPLRATDSRYLDYDRYSPPREPRRSPERQYLDRYVIGDSVVYGSPGYYPRDLRPPSPRGRPPSPTPASSASSRNYRGNQRYTPPNSPRGRGRQPNLSEGRLLTPREKGYSSLSRRSPLRRPPSPPSPTTMSRTTPPPPRRPPSPPSPYQRSNKTSYNRNQSKERYPYKARTTGNLRSPVRTSHGLPSSSSRSNVGGASGGSTGTSGAGGGVVGVSGGSSSAARRDTSGTRDYHQAHRHKETSSSTTSSLGKSSNAHTTQYHHRTERSRDALDMKKSGGGTSGRGSDYRDSTLRDSRRGRTPERSNDSRRDVKVREPDPSSRDRVRSGGSRRIEDRLGLSSSSGRARVRSRSRSRSPAHGGRRSTSRDRKSRRPDDLRLWIELRKSESSKRPASPNRSRQPPAKRLTRPDVGGASSRLRDPKRRMGKGKRRPLPTKGSKLVRKAAGSAANIRRVLKKPKNISKVNRLAVKPRVLKKATTQKLLKDGKETSSGGGGSGNGGGGNSSSSKKQERGEKNDKSGRRGSPSYTR